MEELNQLKALASQLYKMKDRVERVNGVVVSLTEKMQVCETNLSGVHTTLQSAVYDETIKCISQRDNIVSTNARSF